MPLAQANRDYSGYKLKVRVAAWESFIEIASVPERGAEAILSVSGEQIACMLSSGLGCRYNVVAPRARLDNIFV